MSRLNQLYGDLRSIKSSIQPDYLREVQAIISQICNPEQRKQILNYAVSRNNLQVIHELSLKSRVFYCDKVASTSPFLTVQYLSIESRKELEEYIFSYNLYPNLYGIFIDFSKRGFEDYKEVNWLPPFSLESLKVIGLRRLIINQYIVDVMQNTEKIILDDCKLIHSVNSCDQDLCNNSFRLA